MSRKNPSVLWTVDQHVSAITKEGRAIAQKNLGIDEFVVNGTATGIIKDVHANNSHLFVTGMSRNSSTNDLQYTTAQPTLGDLVIDANKKNYSVGTNATTGTVELQDLSVSDPATSGNTDNFQFINSVTQATNGKITPTKKTINTSGDLSTNDSTTLATTVATATLNSNLTGHKHYFHLGGRINSGTANFDVGYNNSNDRVELDHDHGNITNDGKIGSAADLSLVTTTDGAITTANLSTSDPTASGSTLSFIDTISQNTKGKITVTKKSVSKSDAVNSDSSDTLATSKAVYTLNNTLTSLKAFSNVTYDSTTIAASSASDTITVDKSGPVTLTADATNKKLTIGVSVDSAVSSSSTNPLQNSTIASTFIETVTYDSSTAVNEAGTLTLKYHKPTGTSPTGDTSVYTLSGDLTSGIVIRRESNSNPAKFIFQNQRPLPTYNSTNDRNKSLVVKSDGSGLTWNALLPDYTTSSVSGGDVLMVNSGKTGLEWGTPDPVCEIKVQSYFNDPDTITFNSNGNTIAHIDTSNVSLGYLAPPVNSADDGQFLMATYNNGNVTLSWEPSGSGNGDVVGPSSATNERIPLYDGTTGKLIKNSKYYFTSDADSDTSESAKQVKTKAYSDPFRTSQQIVKSDSDGSYLYIENTNKRMSIGISSYGNIKLKEESGKTDSPTNVTDIITSSGTGDSTTYLFKGTADKADALTTSSDIGSSSQPIYLKSNGTVEACDFQIVIGSLPTSNNTIAFL